MQIPHCRKYTLFYSVFLTKMLRVTPHICRKCVISLLFWIRCILSKAHSFTPTTISVTPRCLRKREVWLHFLAEDAQNDLKMHSYEDNAMFHFAFSATTLSYAYGQNREWKKIRISRQIWKRFLKMLAVLCFVPISDRRCKEG